MNVRQAQGWYYLLGDVWPLLYFRSREGVLQAAVAAAALRRPPDGNRGSVSRTGRAEGSIYAECGG